MTDSVPRISVVISSYNFARYLPACIESALAQTLRPFEIIISDDCSTDNSWAIISEYSQKYPQLIRAYRQRENMGPPRHGNFGKQQARGDLIAWMDGVACVLTRHEDARGSDQGLTKMREAMLKVKGLGQKAYEQAAGFVRIKEGRSPFDNSGIHPESYAIAKELRGKDLANIDLDAAAQELNVGKETLRDIVKELQKPGFDPREELPPIPFKEEITDIKMLHEGSIVSGVVRNIADFGAFVDIGLKNDGMIHISKMSEKRIAHPLEILAVNQFLPHVTVVSVDHEKGKVGPSLV